MATKEEDVVTNLFVANTHTQLLFFTTDGMAYKLKTWRLPQGGRTAHELRKARERSHVLCGLAVAVSNVDEVPEGVQLVNARICTEDDDVMLVTAGGRAIRFPTTDVRVFKGRDSTGVRGIRLQEGEKVVSMSVIRHFEASPEERAAYLKMRRAMFANGGEGEGEEIADAGELSPERFQEMLAAEDLLVTITALGQGKLTSSHDYPVRGRGGMGVAAMDKAMRGGPLVACFPVDIEDQIMLATSRGQSIRVPVKDISFRSRSAGGVKVFDTGKGETVVSVARIVESEEAEAEATPDQSAS